MRTAIPDVTRLPLPDLVGRDFAVGTPGERTCGGMTDIPTVEGWLYLADVLDIGSRRVIGYAMADHMRSELVERALLMAVDTRGGDAPCRVHLFVLRLGLRFHAHHPVGYDRT